MPTKSQSPGPNPTTSSPKLARSRKAVVSEQTTGRAGSAGGIVLEQDQKANMSSKPVTKAAATPPAKDAAAAGPNRQRRRPRKLNKEPTSQAPTSTSTPPTTSTTTSTPKPTAATPTAATTKADNPPPASTSEIEALKSRIRSLEAKVEQLYTTTARSPRRRGKARKDSSATTVPTLSRSNTAETGRVEEIGEDEEEADEELVRLEGELETARQDLEAYRPTGRRPKARRSASSGQYEDEDVEEIPRDDFTPGTQSTAGVNKEGRQVTLSGNYRIPLPANVSMSDVKNIQSGVSAAQNVAKSFLEQRRAQAKVNPQPAKTAAPKAKGKPSASTAVSTEMATGSEGGKSWGEWFGGYSVAITRAVKTIEAEAALESQNAGQGKRPAQAGRTASGKSAPVKPTTTKTNAGAVAKMGTRPPLKPRAGNLSTEQVQGLMK